MSELEETNKKMADALREIRRMAQDHPAYWHEAFMDRNINALAKEGGDICDWTMVAITADDALK